MVKDAKQNYEDNNINFVSYILYMFSSLKEIFYSLCASGVMDHLARSDASNFTSLFQEPTVLWGYYSNVPSNFIRYFPYSDCRINKTREGCFDVQFRPVSSCWISDYTP